MYVGVVFRDRQGKGMEVGGKQWGGAGALSSVVSAWAMASGVPRETVCVDLWPVEHYVRLCALIY